MIDVPHLAVFHARILAQRANPSVGAEVPASWAGDTILMRGLGLGLHQTLAYLYNETPSLQAFEVWILEKNGGAIEPDRIAQINAAIDGRIADLAGAEALEPVLDADDLAFWDEHGYVILHDATTPERLQAAEAAIWEFLGMDADDPTTWYSQPHGHSIWVPLLQHPALWTNRRAPRIRSAFAQLWKRNDLWVTVDQAGMNPPETTSWKFPGPDLHFDVALIPPVPLGISGILYLTDTAEDQGAFTCVPGFHKKIDAWLAAFPPDVDPRGYDLAQLEARHIAGRAGDLILWHQGLPHGSSPNRTRRPRMVQYVAMNPSRWDERDTWK